MTAGTQVSVVYKAGAFRALINLGVATIRAESTAGEVDAALRCAAEHYQVAPQSVKLTRLSSGNTTHGRPWVFDAEVKS